MPNTEGTEELVAALRSAGLRITRGRRVVCGVLVSSPGDHLSAPEIHHRTEELMGAPIDQSTIYRTLETLGRAGLITHTHLGHGPSVYHLAAEAPHQHLVCGVCGATSGILEVDLESFLAEITERTGFVPDPTHFAVSGWCAHCAAERSGAAGDVAPPDGTGVA